LKTIHKFECNKPELNYLELFEESYRVLGLFKPFFPIIKAPTCEIEGCEETNYLEQHFINSMVSLKRKNLTLYMKQVIGIKRRIIILCRSHYREMDKRGLFVRNITD
jgi:hypothetical protein